MPIVIATVTPAQGRLDEVRDIFLGLAPRVQQEPGCDLYAVHVGRDRVVIIENWADTDALKAHSSGPVAAEMIAALDELQAQPMDVVRLTAVPAGDADKGAL